MVVKINKQLNKAQDIAISEYLTRQPLNLLSKDTKIKECIEIIKNQDKLRATPKRCVKTSQSAKKPNRSKFNIMQPRYMTPCHERLLDDKNCLEKDYSLERKKSKIIIENENLLKQIQGNYKKVVQDTTMFQHSAKFLGHKVLYGFRYCDTMLRKAAEKEAALFDQQHSFDYYIWQTAKRCMSPK